MWSVEQVVEILRLKASVRLFFSFFPGTESSHGSRAQAPARFYDSHREYWQQGALYGKFCL